MVRILLVDDDDAVCDALRRLLNQLEHEVETATDGEQGLAAFARFAPDVVITDVLMPEMDGTEFLRRIREQDPDARAIAISGGGYGFRSESALDLAGLAGARATIQKPFTLSRLRQALREALDDPASSEPKA